MTNAEPFFVPASHRKPSRRIIEDVAKAHGVTAKDIIGPSRLRIVMIARCEAIRKVSAEWPWLSYPSLGRLFGRRDHTSIMNHLDKSGHGRQTCSCDREWGELQKNERKAKAIMEAVRNSMSGQDEVHPAIKDSETRA
jgi:hypothetical protein